MKLPDKRAVFHSYNYAVFNYCLVSWRILCESYLIKETIPLMQPTNDDSCKAAASDPLPGTGRPPRNNGPVMSRPNFDSSCK